MGLFTVNAPAVKFAKVGDSVEGEIIDVYRSQRFEFVRGGSGQPLYWFNRKPTPGAKIDPATGKKNDPVLQYVLVIETGVPDEDGNTERRVFVKNQRMEAALKKAVIAAKDRRGLLLGGRIKCTFTGFDEKSEAPQPPKTYDFEYTPPALGEGTEPSGEVRVADRDEDAEVTQDLSGAARRAGNGGALYTPSEESFRGEEALTKVMEQTAKKDDDTPPF